MVMISARSLSSVTRSSLNCSGCWSNVVEINDLKFSAKGTDFVRLKGIERMLVAILGRPQPVVKGSLEISGVAFCLSPQDSGFIMSQTNCCRIYSGIKIVFSCSSVWSFTMTTEWGGETSRLWRVWRTVHQMVHDRVFSPRFSLKF